MPASDPPASSRNAPALGDTRSEVAINPFVPPIDATTVTTRPRSRRVWWIAATCALALGALALVLARRGPEAPPAIVLDDVQPPGPTKLEVKVDQPVADKRAFTDTPVHRTPPPAVGLISIDSTPYATIYLDGVVLGVTPIVKRQVWFGRRKLRAVLPNGRAKEWMMDVKVGRQSPPVQLTW